jgi:nitroimidazol reductase NimA-like FMN-containing flavoprotein (pyridoxamine 5'-phosphate oxidase superfamily)
MLGEPAVAEVERLLQSEPSARLGCYVDGRTHVVPIGYVYETSLPSRATAPSTHARDRRAGRRSSTGSV